MNRSSSARISRSAPVRPHRRRHRRAFLEQLEDRALMAALPFGAMPDDTGEYMLGNVKVNVVLMESVTSQEDTTNQFAHHDNGSITYPGFGTVTYTPENWTQAAKDAVKANIEAGLQWWKDTLDALPNVRDGLLNFDIDWTYLENPVKTGYEPIARISDDFTLWIDDFFDQVGFNTSINFSNNIRAFNNFTRQQGPGYDWAFTIFVVNDTNDPDKQFTQFPDLGSFRRAFSYSGGRFAVGPASRPASSFAHETGHQFWALDEYPGASTYLAKRGYYDTQNTNAADNPAFENSSQADSIMSNNQKLADAFAAHTSSPSSLEMIGWKDSDGDGIFDVLDVPFSLTGTGSYSGGSYHFTGKTSVKTLPNRNSSGLADDITINQLRVVEASIDNGPWNTIQTFPSRTYQADLNLDFAVPTGQHTVKIRVADTTTGVMSPEFVGNTSTPTSMPSQGINGFVFLDQNGDGAWNSDEPALRDYALTLLDENDQPVSLQHRVEPSEKAELALLNNVEPGATLTTIGPDADDNKVIAKTSVLAPGAGKVFANNSSITNNLSETWTSSGRQLRVDFAAPVGLVSIRAYSGMGSTPSFGRLEAYNAAGQLLERVTSGELTGSNSALLSISRANGDIAYVIAGAHGPTEVVLDSLLWGPASSTTTNTLGAYSLAYLPAGTYHVKAEAPAGHDFSTPPGGVAVVTVGAGQAVSNVNFGVHPLNGGSPSWHNSTPPLNGLDVDGDFAVSPIDAIIVINWLNAHPGNSTLPMPPNPLVQGYLDVDNDNACSPIDALLVINWLNAHVGSGGGSGGEGEQLQGGSSSGGQGSGGGGSGEGEDQLAAPRNAAEYFARNPIHFVNIAGTDEPCTCAQCMAAHTESTPVSTAGNATNGGPLSTPFEPLETNSSRPLSILQSLRTAVTSVQSASSRVLASALASSGQVSAAKAHSSLEEAIDLIASDVSKKEPSQGDAEISASLDAD